MSLVLSIVEGTKESLQRLGLDYVDIIFAHRPDPSGEPSFRLCPEVAKHKRMQSR